MRRLRLFGPAVVIAVAAVVALSGRWPWRRMTAAASYPAESAARAAVAATPIVPVVETTDTLRRGETVSHIFARNGIPTFDLAALGKALDPRRLRSGLVFHFRKAPDDSMPNHIMVRTAPEQRIVFSRVADNWNAEVEPIRWRTEELRVEGTIDNSLYEALDANLSDEQLNGDERQRFAWDLADVYEWQVDFTRDIQPGDRFRVVFERLVSEDGEVRFGRVLAGELTASGKQLTAFRFAGAGEGKGFYDVGGNSLKRAFLRAPLEFRRISSSFTGARFHPILGRVRRHEGTDYAAAPGTPVRAAGDGVVLRAGQAGGYGNLIELRHRSGITTRYGHLRGFASGIHAGARVSQGETIGFVGSTGLATGPHLHYEFRVDGVARDSRRVELGNGAPIAPAQRAAFEQERDRLQRLLQGDRAPRDVAARGTTQAPTLQ